MDAHTPPTNPHGLTVASRRDFLKRSAVAGAAVWTAPAIASLPGAGAWAADGTPCPCESDALALAVRIPPSGSLVDLAFDRGAEDPCVANVDTKEQTTALGTIRVQATTVCADESPAGTVPCTAEASIQTLDVTGTALGTLSPISTTVLASQASANCFPCEVRGSSTIASLTVGTTTVDVNSLLGSCNVDVLGLGVIVFNEQACAGETLTVTALHLLVPNVVEVIAARSQAAAEGCPCQACAA